MTYFLEDIARYLFNKNNGDFQHTVIVFPNRRAKLFFNDHLAHLSEKPLWAPDYFTITDFIIKLSGLQIADQITLLFRLFKIYKEVSGSNETFDTFYYYCEILLADFDDIDKYRLDANKLFRNLSELKSMEDYGNYLDEYQLNTIRQFWNIFAQSKDSPEKDKFISLWNILYKIYTLLVDELDGEGIAYEGMAYRKAVDRLEKDAITLFPDKQLIFIGFNALNRSEELLFDFFRKRSNTLFFWDFDQSYIKNEKYEAGFFLRNYLKSYPQPEDFNPASEADHSQEILTISVPSVISQAKVIEYCLKRTDQRAIVKPSQTAIILADENLLPSVLNSLPPEIKEINISMGYPVLETSIFSFIMSLMDLQRNKRQNKDASSTILYYHTDLFNILKHTFLQRILPVEKLRDFEQACKKLNSIFIDPSELLSLHPLLPKIFRAFDNPKEFVKYLREIIESIGVYGVESETKSTATAWQIEILHRVHQLLTLIETQIADADVNIQLQTIIGLLRKILSKTTVPFVGEPLSGIQIMGILETRTLDFDTIIILSMNEGTFPKTGHAPSFIPYTLREGFGLPTLKHQDAIYAYYFYRLMHRSKQLNLVYNTKSEGLHKGEPSRYILQLNYEQDTKADHIDMGYKVSSFSPFRLQGKHTDDVKLKLLKFLQRENKTFLSPSAINTYLNCKLRFYYKYVEDIKEPESIEEIIETNVFGSILHRSMSILYADFKQRKVLPEDIKKIVRDDGKIENAIHAAFGEEYFHRNSINKSDFRGRNLIIKKVIDRYIRGILSYDISSGPFRIESLEERYEASVPLDESGRIVTIGGYIDRLDEKDGFLRVVDYKTGMLKSTFSSIEELFDSSLKKRNDAVFQTFLYCYIVSKSGYSIPIQPSLFFVREVFRPEFDIRVYQSESRKKMVIDDFHNLSREFEKNLIKTLNELFSSDNNFDQTVNAEQCKNCPYNVLCRRKS